MNVSGRGIRAVWLVVLLTGGAFCLPIGGARIFEAMPGPRPAFGASIAEMTRAQEADPVDEDAAAQAAPAHLPPFTVAGIAGTYASTNIGRGGQFPVSDVGVFAFDGAGKFSGTVNVNLPTADFRQRQVFQSAFTGTYTVDAEGTGTTIAKFTLPDGTTRETPSHFVITKAGVQAGKRIATEFKLVADNLSFTSGNLDVAVLQKIPSAGFSNASLLGTYGFQAIGRGGWQPTADAGLTSFDGQGNTTVYFNQNIPGGENIPGTPGNLFFQREVFSSNVSFAYEVNSDGTGKSDVAHFVITQAKRIDNKLVATEVFFIADALDPFSGNLQTTIATRLSPNPNPGAGGFSVKSLKGTYGGKVIGRGGQTQQITAAALTFDGAGRFDGSGVINLPGEAYGQRIFFPSPFVGTYKVRRDGFGTTLNGGESYFAITKSALIDGVKVATEFALVVKELQPTGNLITAIFTRLPDGGTLSEASLRGTYAASAIGRGGQMPEAGVGIFTFNGAGGFSSQFRQNIPGDTVFDRQIFEGSVGGSYSVAATGLGQTFVPGGESTFVVTKASVRNNVKVADEFFLIVKDYSPFSRSILATVGTRIGN